MTAESVARAVLEPTAEPARLRKIFGRFPTGVVAVCADIEGKPAGMAVSSFTSVSLQPPLVSICVAETSTTWPELRQAPRLGVSILSAGHATACRQLSAKTGDRFAGLAVERTDLGGVFVLNAAGWLECAIEHEIRAGDHLIVLLRIEAVAVLAEAPPLVFHASRFSRLVEM